MRLKELRKSKRLTQSDMASFIGVNQNTYSYWENGKTKIDNETLEKLADYFNVSVDYLLGREESDTNYYDPEVAEMINAAHKDPDLRVLFSASKKLTKDELQAVLSMIKVMSKEG